MKRILSFVFAAAFAVTASSQTFWSDNFETYTVGNLGSQGGWGRDGGSNSMIKIANIDGAHGKSMQFASTAANADGMWVFKDINFGTSTPGNDVFSAEWDMYTGNNGAEVQLYENVGEWYAIFDIYMSPTAGAWLADQADFDAEEDGELLSSSITANTWYKVKVEYHTEEGTIDVWIDGTHYGPFQKEGFHYPTEFDVVAVGTNNSGFDNLVMSAKPALAVANVSKAKVNVYPNPVSNLLNIISDKKIASVSIFDASGKAVKTSTETSINVENLAKGAYIVNINFADGTSESKKVIKK